MRHLLWTPTVFVALIACGSSEAVSTNDADTTSIDATADADAIAADDDTAADTDATAADDTATADVPADTDATAPDTDAISDDTQAPPALVDGVSLHVTPDLCVGLPGVTVALLDGALLGTTDAYGDVTLNGLPSSAALVLRAPGHVDTLTAVRSFAPNTTAYAAITPQSTYTLAHLISDLPPDPERGGVVVSVINEAALPIAGVQVELVGGGGDTGTRRYVGGVEALLTFDEAATATQPHVGFVIFMNVPPGTYQVQATRGSDVFPAMTVVVRAGAVTGDDLVRPGDDGTEPALLTGTISASPVLPASGPAAPAPNLSFVVHDIAGDRDFPVTTGADGTYTLPLPFARSNVDLTFAEAPYGVERTPEICIGSLANPANWRVDDHRWSQYLLAQSLAGGALDPTRGSVAIVVYAGRTSSLGYAGATVTLDPPAVPPSYGQDVVAPCVTAPTCAPACPTNSRCEEGVCIAGLAAPTCSRCGAGCASGYSPLVWSEQGALVCRCMPERADCAEPTPACDPGMYCHVPLATTPTSVTPGQPRCLPLAASGATTAVTSDGRPLWVAMSNLAPAEYALRVGIPDEVPTVARVRITPGVIAAFRVNMP